jgi:hypothetical protein
MDNYQRLTDAERNLYHQVEQDATGRDLLDVLLNDHADVPACQRAAVADAIGGPGGGAGAFRAAWTRRELDNTAKTNTGAEPNIVRRFDDGRTAIAHATVEQIKVNAADAGRQPERRRTDTDGDEF